MVKKIYIAKVYFTSMTDYKERPVLVIKEYEKNDIIYLPLTTSFKKIGMLKDSSYEKIMKEVCNSFDCRNYL